MPHSNGGPPGEASVAGRWYGMVLRDARLTHKRPICERRWDDQTKKGLLWDYTKAVSELEAFRVQFRAVADRLDLTAKLKSGLYVAQAFGQNLLPLPGG
jgi:hypothetical protein